MEKEIKQLFILEKKIYQRFNSFDYSFSVLNERLDSIDNKISSVEKRLGKIEQRLSRIKS